MTAYVALLRGINLGGRRKVAMADLRELVADLGYVDVRTHLQSGNVVFGADTRSAATVEKALEQAIASTLRMDVRVVVRSAKQLAAVVAANPFESTADDPARYLVVFLEKAVPASWVASVDPESFAPETLAVAGKELFLWLPGGVNDSPLGKAVLTKKLGGAATARNWRTVTRLAEMASE